MDDLRVPCWNCGRPIWFCKTKHFVTDVAVGLFWGLLIGGAAGGLLALIHNLFFDPIGGGRWS